jgi:MFS superfamily sulfate permease-like transporter
MRRLAVWAVMVPEGMAYAGIVGVPPIMDLFTIVPPLIAYALLGTSRLLVVGPDTATGLTQIDQIEPVSVADTRVGRRSASKINDLSRA